MEQITPIGTTNHQNKNQIFGINEKDRTGHIYCIGKTGTGKSTLLLNMAIHDIQTGKGTGIIDPHGDLANVILDYIPEERIKDVIYFNAADRDYPIAFNPLYKVAEQNRFLVADNIVSVFKKLWPDSWGPRLEHILRYTILSLLYYPHATLLDIQSLLTDNSFRQLIMTYQTDKSVIHFWQKEFEPLAPQTKNEVISPILNKVGILNSNTTIRNIIGQKISSFTISEVMNKQKLLIVNLSKGYLGEAGTAFLGALLVTQFQTASLERAQIKIFDRKPFYLYIDEMHSFVTLSFTDILSESRKYGLSLFLTHQFLDQLHEDISRSILGNVGTLISFRIGSTDAAKLEDEFYPVFAKDDILTLPQYHIYLKLLIDGTQSAPFSAVTTALPVTKTKTKELCVHYSRKKYALTVTSNYLPHTDKQEKEPISSEGKQENLFE